MSEADDKRDQMIVLREIARSLRELVAWTRVMGYPVVRQMLEKVLDSDEKRLVYHLTDGRRSIREIQDMTGVNVRHVSEWGQEWERIGIVESSHVSSVKGRRQRVFNLTDFGFQIPEVD